MAMTLHRKREILIHTTFWAVYLSFIITHITSYQTGPQIHWGRVLLAALISMSYLIVLSYLNYLYLIPAFLLRKKIGAFIMAFVACFVALTLVRIGVETLAFGKSWETQSSARTQIIV